MKIRARRFPSASSRTAAVVSVFQAAVLALSLMAASHVQAHDDPADSLPTSYDEWRRFSEALSRAASSPEGDLRSFHEVLSGALESERVSFETIDPHSHESPDVAVAPQLTRGERVRQFSRRKGRQLVEGVQNLGAMAYQASRSHGTPYLAYTLITEAIDHGLEPFFPLFYAIQLHLVTQPAYFALANTASLMWEIMLDARHGTFPARFSVAQDARRVRNEEIRAARSAEFLDLDGRTLRAAQQTPFRRMFVRVARGNDVRDAFAGRVDPRLEFVMGSRFWSDVYARVEGVERVSPQQEGNRGSASLETADARTRLAREYTAAEGAHLSLSVAQRAVDIARSERRLTYRQFLYLRGKLGDLDRSVRQLQSNGASEALLPEAEETLAARADLQRMYRAVLDAASQVARVAGGEGEPLEALEFHRHRARIDATVADLRSGVREHRRAKGRVGLGERLVRTYERARGVWSSRSSRSKVDAATMTQHASERRDVRRRSR